MTSFLVRRGTVAALALATLIAVAPAARAQSVVLEPSRDNAMFQESGALSNGTGPHLFAGETQFGAPRRSLMAFDIAGNIPAGAVVTSASLTMFCSREAPGSGVRAHTLHRVTADWGEGASDSGVPGGAGAPAAPGDATWDYRFFSTDLWASPGGDFVGAASASTGVGSPGVLYTWASTAATAADVQSWLDSPATNFGWILIGDETFGTAKRFESRENAVPANRPLLTVDYIVPTICGDGSVDAGEDCDAGAGNSDAPDATCRTDCTLARCGDSIIDGDAPRFETCDPPGGTCGVNCTFCGDGVLDAGEECDDGNSIDTDACNNTCVIQEPFPIPTMGEWGLMILAMLLLSLGTIVLLRSSAVLAGSGGTSMSVGDTPPLFVATLFARLLALAIGVALLGLMVAAWVGRTPSATDVVGSLLCAPIAAYLVHLWVSAGRR